MGSLYSYLKKSTILWKILGIVAVTFLVLSSTIIKGSWLEEFHNEIKLWAFLFILLLCGLLIKDILKIVKNQQAQIEDLMGIKLALISLIDLRDPYTEGHSRNVRDLTRRFTEYLKLPPIDVEEITMAAELHDIGKIGFPDTILKNIGNLNEQEFNEVKKHPLRGADSIQSLKGFENIVKIIRHHHEKYDGTGYPDGLSSKQIPLGSRIISLIDAYDAMIHDRSYQNMHEGI